MYQAHWGELGEIENCNLLPSFQSIESSAFHISGQRLVVQVFDVFLNDVKDRSGSKTVKYITVNYD